MPTLCSTLRPADDPGRRHRRADLPTVYFAAQPDPRWKWMYYAGLVITGIDVLVALAITDRMLAASRRRQFEAEAGAGP